MIDGRVAIIAPRYAPAVGGVERQAEMIATGLARRGVIVEVITTDPGGSLPPTEERAGVLVRRFPTLGGDSVYFLAPRLGWWLLRNASRFCLLHAHSYHTPLALQAALASRVSGIPLVVTPCYHGTGHSPFRAWLHTPYRAMGAWVLHQARAVICISRAEEALVRSHFGPRVRTVFVPSAVDPAPFAGAEPKNPPGSRRLILAVGRLDDYKQTDRVIHALPGLPDHELVVIGKGPRRPWLEWTVGRLGLEARVRLLEWVPQEELVAWYRRADAFVSLSLRESFGLALLEAAVAGCAVIASDIPAHREVAGYVPAGRVTFVRPDCSPAEVADAVRAAPPRLVAPDVRGWPLPNREHAIDLTLMCYRAALDGSRATFAVEPAG